MHCIVCCTLPATICDWYSHLLRLLYLLVPLHGEKARNCSCYDDTTTAIEKQLPCSKSRSSSSSMMRHQLLAVSFTSRVPAWAGHDNLWWLLGIDHCGHNIMHVMYIWRPCDVCVTHVCHTWYIQNACDSICIMYAMLHVVGWSQNKSCSEHWRRPLPMLHYTIMSEPDSTRMSVDWQ